MDQRQKDLLNLIVCQYVKTATPVGSKLVSQDPRFNLSSATIRNEMMALEDAGYIYQPHTSAGRAPTLKGYEFYVANFLADLDLAKPKQEFLRKAVQSFKTYEPTLVKQLAKGVAELASNTVFVGFSKADFYYTGLSNLFAQPEFNQHEFSYNISRVIDHFDRVLEKLFSLSDFEDDVEILIGKKNPFGSECGSVVVRYQIRNEPVVFGILGPARMDYQNNFSLIKYSQSLINNFTK